MNQLDISKIMVDSKHRVATIKGETAHFDVDIPLSSHIISELSGKLCIEVELFNKDTRVWVKSKRYYQGSKDTMDFDLHPIKDLRRNIKILL